jgi:hypothetical protein
MEVKYRINIANDFSPYPAGRYRKEGDTSGEAFLQDVLLGKLLAAIFSQSILEINLDGMNGYPSSFISGSFGKLANELGKVVGKNDANSLLSKHINFICTDSATRKQAILDELKDPITKK